MREKDTPAQRLTKALTHYVTEGGELAFKEDPPRGVYPIGQSTRTITITVDAKAYDDACYLFRGY